MNTVKAKYTINYFELVPDLLVSVEWGFVPLCNLWYVVRVQTELEGQQTVYHYWIDQHRICKRVTR